MPDFTCFDSVPADSLEPGDFILIDGNYSQIVAVRDHTDSIAVDYQDDFEEVQTTDFDPYQDIDLYTIVDEDEDI